MDSNRASASSLRLGSVRWRSIRAEGVRLSSTCPARGNPGMELRHRQATALQSGDQLLIPLIGPMKVVGIEKRAPQAWTIREKGHLKTWKTSQKGDTLQVETSGETTVYRRLDSVPRECIFKTLSIGPAQELPRERVSAISKEILERVDRDQ